jgi:oligoendopeptidase F
MRLPIPAQPAALDAVAEVGGAPLGDLPDWDLSDLYAAPDAPELARDLDWLETECAAFAADYEGKLADLSAADLLTCIERHEKIDMIAGRIMSFAGLRYYQQTTNPERAKFMSDMQDKITTMTTPLVFFSLEFNRIADDRYDALMAENAGLARYKPVLDRMRAMKPYQLSDELERFLHDLRGRRERVEQAVRRNHRGAEFRRGGRDARHRIHAEPADRPGPRQTRGGAARAGRDLPGTRLPLFARVHNTLAKEKEIGDRWRKLPTPQASRHLANHVEPKWSRRCATRSWPPIPACRIATTR